MRCPKCKHLSLALKAFDNGREIWACQRCDFRSKVLDCHFCERRGVMHIGQNEKSVSIWHCGQCGVQRHQCPKCSKGWVSDASLLKPGSSGYCCDHCHHVWPSLEALGRFSAV